MDRLGSGNGSGKGICSPRERGKENHSHGGRERIAANRILVHCSFCKQCIFLRSSEQEPRIHIWRSPAEGERAVWAFAVGPMATGQDMGGVGARHFF